ncbi:MAG: signal peptidase I [Opitutaceae bacterium]|jgi:signal peptidase I
MFGFFDSQEKKMRDNASNWLELASKVWNYRRDRLNARESDELVSRTKELNQLLKNRADAAKLKLGIESLEGVLMRTGGAIYPKTSLVENVEFFLVAAIVILGIRTYFVQPFKIPTNSMWPTYYGMTSESFPPGSRAPNYAERAFRFIAYGAEGYSAVAPRDGEVSVPLVIRGDKVSMAYTLRNGRSWLVLPSRVKEYTFYVDGAPVSVQVPADFSDFDDVVFNTFFTDHAALLAQIQRAGQAGQIEEVSQKLDENNNGLYEALRVPMGRTVRAGEPLVRFDILTGDQLFVDRVSYQFMRPTVGQGFVFRTDNIPEIERTFGAQYFIKRLIGVPGDSIEMREPMIYRNGAPITGSAAFEMNAKRVSPYRGYFNATHEDSRYSQLFKGETVQVPEDSYLALGDNSMNSFDGRFWGFVPSKDVIGRPLFIYYPFTRRWGPAK